MSEILPPSTAESSRFEPPRLRQFTVFLDNRVGRLQALLRLFEQSNDPIVSLAVEESADSALVRLICREPDRGAATLRHHGYVFSEVEVLVVELASQSHKPLIAICSALLSAEINIHYVYPLLAHPRGSAVVVYVDDAAMAAEALIKKGFTLLVESDFPPLTSPEG